MMVIIKFKNGEELKVKCDSVICETNYADELECVRFITEDEVMLKYFDVNEVLYILEDPSDES